ncbi:MAG TPA: SMP-30/gluconolactonase/LRE family protein [Pyrinomonadaceae bacterium]|nr:SMP-30/gluconolactonase/LRE family protein [Pyrinomonadaceae bacterium]
MKNNSDGPKTNLGLTRRGFIAGAIAAPAATALLARPSSYGQDAAQVRYPDPNVIVLDKRFAKYRVINAAIERLYTGMRWAEGPAWNGAGRYLVWSDIPNNVKHRWLAEDGHVSVFHSPSNYSNGNTFDWQGRLISCEHDTHRVVRFEQEGTTTVLAESWQGKPLNAPNDVIVHPDGGIWFTDPGYSSLYEGGDRRLSQKEAVYRIDPKTGKMEMVTDTMYKPNGLCFSPDHKKLYIAETGASHYPAAPPHIMAFDVVDGQKLGTGKEFTSTKMKMQSGEVVGFADGIRADADGNIWAGVGWVGPGYDGVHVFAPDGERIGQILLPEICANLCFGGPKRNRLFMTASQSLYSLYVEVQGAHIA